MKNEGFLKKVYNRFFYRINKSIPFLVLLPSIILATVFIYIFIGYNAYVSLSNWNTLVPDLSFAGLKNYIQLFKSFRFQSDIRNMIFFSVLFIFGVIAIGQLLAILLHQDIKFKWLFRNIFLIPMAVSFVVTGVAWRWIFNPVSGVNIFLDKLGWSPGWYTNTAIYPGWKLFKIEIGLPIAMIAVLIAAIWQMTGFSLAMYLAGLGAVSEELREAAQIDGANSWQVHFKIVLPQLRPITFSLILLLFNSALKIFDLVYTMTGSGPNFVTDMPALYMYETTFMGKFYAEGAAIGILMLIVVLFVILPLMRQREEEA